MTRTYKTFKDIQKLTVFVFSRQVHLLKYFFMSILPIQMMVGGGVFFSKQVEAKRTGCFPPSV